MNAKQKWKQQLFERMLSNLQHTYLIIHCGSNHMTDRRLMEIIQNTLCDTMGDQEFCLWLAENAPNKEHLI